MIYFITDGTFIKIGTAKCVKARLSGLVGGNARSLTVLATCEGDKSIEKRLHHAVPSRVPGSREWFKKSSTLANLIDAVAAGDGSLPHLTSLVAAMEADIAEQRSRGKAQAKADKVAFRARSAAMIERLCKKYGTRTVAAYSGQTIGAISYQRRGQMIPGSLAITRLGMLDRDEVDRLMRPCAAPPPILPDLRAAQVAINALICRAERIAA